MHEEAKDQHRWLGRLVGSWSYEVEYDMGPDQPAGKSTGTEVVRSLGGLWTVAEGAGTTLDGAPAQTIKTLGFDPRTGRFVGTVVASMMTQLWVCDGALDAAGRALTLEAEGPDFTSTKLTKYRDILEFLDDDRHVLRSEVQADDGTWHHFMTAHYRRTA